MSGEPRDFDMPGTFRLEQPARAYVDTGSFRDAMASMAATACLVTTQCGAERLGRTVTSVFSLSIEPPAILVSIDMSSRMADHIVRTLGFSLSMLAQGQQAIADAFAGKGDPERRFDTGRWLAWESGHPRLWGAVVAMDCALLGAMETGTHVLFAGGIVDIDLASARAPLIWHDRQYKALAEPSNPSAASFASAAVHKADALR
ncbi:MAG: flavin reductase [Phyllobacteriaceae bacterium]|nr:flavin reductase [Phyllobacteriaceae bacterium]MBA92766.1 flavin reductase [Phyllobacteriaceae bacterium]